MTPKQRLEDVYRREKELEKEKLEIYSQSTRDPDELKVCDNAMAHEMVEMLQMRGDGHFIEFPINVLGIHTPKTNEDGSLRRKDKVGGFVQIRPCVDGPPKTYLGVYVGDLPFGVSASYNRASEVLSLHQGNFNPAIFVPALKRLVYGFESWWCFIESPEQLRQISDEDINSIWYVRALKELGGAKDTKDASDDFDRIDKLHSVDGMHKALEALDPERRKAAIFEGLKKSRFQWWWSSMAQAFEIPESEWPDRTI